jgi:hypothetical protein
MGILMIQKYQNNNNINVEYWKLNIREVESMFFRNP